MLFLLLQLETNPQQPDLNVIGDTWSLTMMVLKMCLTLGAVCILAFLVLRYGLPKLTGLQPQGGLVRVVTRFPLEPQKSLYIVEVAGKSLLLGVTSDRIDLLTQLDSEQIEQIREESAKASPRLGTEFSKYLRR